MRGVRCRRFLRVAKSGARGVLLLALGFALPAELRADQAVSFRLVPARDSGPPRAAGGPVAGRVQLFREGDFRPSFVFAAGGPPRVVPTGRWTWIADAPGSVSVGNGALDVADAGPDAAPKLVASTMVPACELTLAPDPRWQRMDGLTLVSLPYSTVYPLDPKTVRAQKIPAGRYLAYSSGARGLFGIGRIASCKAGEVETIRPPEAPDKRELDLLVHVSLPDLPALDPQALAIAVTQEVGEERSAVAAPSVGIWNGRRGSFFFLGVPAADGLAVSIVHPRLRTRTVPVGARGGGARELPELPLKARRSLAFLVDYRPARAHQSARVLAYRCGRKRLDGMAIDVRRCRYIGQERALKDGPSALSFEDLDDGQYAIDAVVDGERVSGLGDRFAPFLDPHTDDPPNVSPLLLPEIEVYGSLLRGGQAVPGAVRLGRWGGSLQTFATDRDLVYHLFYFAHRADRAALAAIPEDLQRLDRAAMRGLYDLYTLEACDGGGACRLFDADSTLTGGGHLDLDLGADRGLDVQVVVARTGGQPVGDAVVEVAQGDPALHFVRGEVGWKPSLHEVERISTDGYGWARLRGLEPGGVFLTAMKPGFNPGRATAEVEETGRATFQIEIDPDGAPAEAPAESYPEEVPPADLPGTLPPGGAGGSAAARAPVMVRLSDAEGRPLAGVPLVLRSSDFELGPKALFDAALSDRVLFYMTDARGEATLYGLDPAAAGKAALATATDLGIPPVPLANVPPGGTVALVAPD